jgi:hypothetical protein
MILFQPYKFTQAILFLLIVFSFSLSFADDAVDVSSAKCISEFPSNMEDFFKLFSKEELSHLNKKDFTKDPIYKEKLEIYSRLQKDLKEIKEKTSTKYMDAQGNFVYEIPSKPPYTVLKTEEEMKEFYTANSTELNQYHVINLERSGGDGIYLLSHMSVKDKKSVVALVRSSPTQYLIRKLKTKK